MPQMIERKVFVDKKNITSQFRNELQALKERLYGIDNFVQEQFPQTSQTSTDDLKAQLADMRSQFANLSKQLVQPRPHALPESLMQILNQAPPVQSLNEIMVKNYLPDQKSGSIRIVTSTRKLILPHCSSKRK